MRWFKEVWTKSNQFLIEKRYHSGKYFIDITFYLGPLQYISSSEMDTELDMEEEFDTLSPIECQEVLENAKSSLN